MCAHFLSLEWWTRKRPFFISIKIFSDPEKNFRKIFNPEQVFGGTFSGKLLVGSKILRKSVESENLWKKCRIEKYFGLNLKNSRWPAREMRAHVGSTPRFNSVPIYCTEFKPTSAHFFCVYGWLLMLCCPETSGWFYLFGHISLAFIHDIFRIHWRCNFIHIFVVKKKNYNFWSFFLSIYLLVSKCRRTHTPIHGQRLLDDDIEQACNAILHSTLYSNSTLAT